MASLKALAVAMLAASASALPASFRMSSRQLAYHDLARRQNENAGQQGLNDFDILQLFVFPALSSICPSKI